jgi:hypothetical protein
LQGFRHISIGRQRVDPVVSHALHTAGIPLGRLAALLPGDLSVWCDPGAVTTRVGNSGELRVAQVFSAWAPPSPALSVKASEFKPSPPSSPLAMHHSGGGGGEYASRSNENHRRGDTLTMSTSGPPGLNDQGSPSRHYRPSEAMTPPFARFNSNPPGFYQQHQHQHQHVPFNF